MIEMENGSSGAILPEKMSYSFADGRIKIVKNGETVLDREIRISPSNNYCVDVGDEVDIKPAEEVNEFFGFGKKNNDQLSQAKNNAVNSLNSIAGDIDAEKKLRETMKAKLMAGKTGVAKEEFNVGNMLPIGQGANGGYYVEVLSVSQDVLFVYNSPVSEYAERELQDESLFHNKAGETVQGIPLERGDIIELSAVAFTGTISDDASVSYDKSTEKYIVSGTSS
jgi:hypothetical protein